MLELPNLRWSERTSDDMRAENAIMSVERGAGVMKFLHKGFSVKIWHEDTSMLNDEFPDLLNRGSGPPVDLDI